MCRRDIQRGLTNGPTALSKLFYFLLFYNQIVKSMKWFWNLFQYEETKGIVGNVASNDPFWISFISIPKSVCFYTFLASQFWEDDWQTSEREAWFFKPREQLERQMSSTLPFCCWGKIKQAGNTNWIKILS